MASSLRSRSVIVESVVVIVVVAVVVAEVVVEGKGQIISHPSITATCPGRIEVQSASGRDRHNPVFHNFL